MTSVQIRDDLIRVLRLDLIGPEPDDAAHAAEVLPGPPSRAYIAGFLVPRRAAVGQRADETGREEIAVGTEGGGKDDDEPPEPASSRRVFFPSSLGVSVLVPAGAATIRVEARWGEYRARGDADGSSGPRGVTWERTARTEALEVPVGAPTMKPTRTMIANSAGPEAKSGGLEVVASVRPVSLPAGADGAGALPAGTRAVSIFLVNDRDPAPDDRRDEGFVFQARLRLSIGAPGFVPRPDVRGLDGGDWDARVADLQFHDACEFAVGHGVATVATDADGKCREVTTAWIPDAEVEKVEPAEVPGVELSMEALAAVASPAEARARLGGLVTAYSAWIEAQRTKAPQTGARAEVAKLLLHSAGVARDRIARGLDALEWPDVLEAFRLANRVMARAARQRGAVLRGGGVEPASLEDPAWRPFQIAFLLMNLPGIAEPAGHDRDIVDLLFFPTGGGKTEAYLGLAAFTLVLRRLRNPGLQSAGVSVLMRYTLRLLTLDQLGRAATLICALELEREKDVDRLGTWPFEIGLWVGLSATPNRMGRKGENDPHAHTARAKTHAFQRDSSRSSPIPLETCPWCGEKFSRNSFILTGPGGVSNDDAPIDLRVGCASRSCEFRGGQRKLPIVAVDEPIYRRLPCFLIATVDKFAGLPWVGQSGALFGNVGRHDRDGFYGPCDPGRGRPLDRPLLPPDLVIQDELHLISGPLGTMVGLYETAIDALATREEGGRAIRPKIVASTATVRRAEPQIRAIFGRVAVEVFPPPGPERRDSFFAQTVASTVRSARRYVGIAAQGRSMKVILLRTYLALLAAAERAFLAGAEGGRRNAANPADPYMTLVGYFNSLRELGGSRRIVEDEVKARVAGYARRRRVGEAAGEFADRTIRYDVVELTSREPTSRVADAKRRLALGFGADEAVDVALATNMISVGLDIQRLGLMVVLGQPKTTAEYIQATSRVGRDDAKPGLVVTLLNLHRPRDRSHFERFEAYHETFYRAVEATSATPFSPRAVDRGLAGVVIALARHWSAALEPARGAAAVGTQPQVLERVAETVSRRAEAHDGRPAEDAERLRQQVRGRVKDLADEWIKIAAAKQAVAAGLQYNKHEEPGLPPLLFEPLSADLAAQPPGARKFKAHRSLRDVEPSVNLWLKWLHGAEVEDAP